MAVDIFKLLEIMHNYQSLWDVKSNMYKDELQCISTCKILISISKPIIYQIRFLVYFYGEYTYYYTYAICKFGQFTLM